MTGSRFGTARRTVRGDTIAGEDGNLTGKQRIRLLRENGTGTMLLIAASCFLFLANVLAGGGNRFWIALTGGGVLQDFGETGYASVFSGRQFWRLLLCGHLHLGIFHLLFNLIALRYTGNAVEKVLGITNFLLLYQVGMSTSVAIWCLCFRHATMLGASAGIYVLIGFLSVCDMRGNKFFWPRLSTRERRYLIGYIVLGNLLAPLTTAIHVISFLCGAFCGLVAAGHCTCI